MGEKMRLQKFIAGSGTASRRHAEELIREGRIRVNGIVVTEMGTTVSSEDRVECDGIQLRPINDAIYIMVNKPAGYVTTVSDPRGRKTVMDLIPDIKERVYPVGRLDYDTTGLLILTNDGDFTFASTHPGHEVNKTYLADVSGIPSEEEMGLLRKGVMIDGRLTSPAGAELVEKGSSRSVIKVTIHEGRNRQVKKMCEAIGHPVASLTRIAFGRLTLKGLKPGQWRYLTPQEINLIKGDQNGQI